MEGTEGARGTDGPAPSPNFSPAEPPPPPSAPPFPASASPNGQRFRPRRFLARGGLGEVLVAEDAELHREVALKRILSDQLDRDDARVRFFREAELTGRLEHPGVVPVYGLGVDPRGRPFYAMRLISGRSLETAVDEFHAAEWGDVGRRTVAFRKLLQSFVSVCQTMAFAHSRGIIHRDLKPVNVMLGEYGETLVVDWGLAKAITPAAAAEMAESGPPAETAARSAPRPDSSAEGAVPPPRLRLSIPDSDSALPAPSPVAAMSAETVPGMSDGTPGAAGPSAGPSPSDTVATGATATGSCLGTPGYMSPEQCIGDRGLGPATDIYSLGATLYEIITGRPPLDNLPTLGKLFDTSRGLVPPARSVNRSAPPALEAVCGRAMALRPADRYRDAAALAADLEAWLAGEPVSAWREPLSVRASRWVRRNRTLVGTAAGALMAVTAASAVAVALLNAKNAELEIAKRAAEESRDAARGAELAERAARTDAERARDAERDAKEAAQAARDAERRAKEEAVGERRRAAANFRLADEAVDDLLTTVRGSRDLFSSPGLDVLRTRLLEQVLKYCRAVRGQEAGGDAEFRYALARSTLRTGNILCELGRVQEGADSYRAAIAAFSILNAEAPDNPDYRDALAAAGSGLGRALREVGRPADAERALRESVDGQRKLMADRPDRPDYAFTLAEALGNLALVRRRAGDPAEAERLLREALGLFEGVAARNPKLPETRERVASTRENLGTLLLSLGRNKDADAEYRAALAVREALAAEHPQIPETLHLLAGTRFNLALVMAAGGDRKGAVAELRKAVDVRERVVAMRPDRPDFREGLARACHNLGSLLADEGDADGAERAYRAALAQRERLAADNPDRPDLRDALGRTQHSLGTFLFRAAGGRDRARLRAAAETLRAAVATRRSLADTFPARPEPREELAASLKALGDALGDLRDAAACERAFREAAAVWERLSAENPRRLGYLVALGGALHDAGAAADLRSPEDALVLYGRALETLEPSLRAAPDNGPARDYAALTLTERAWSLARLGRYADAAEDWKRVAEFAKPRMKPAALAREALCRAAAKAAAGDHASAAKAAEEAAAAFDAAHGSPENRHPTERYDLARVRSLCSAAAASDPALPPAERTALAERHAEAALAEIRRLGELGSDRLFAARTDKAFDAVRGREGYKAALAAVEAAVKAMRE